MVYIVETNDGSLYTGICKGSVDKRVEKHNSGKGAKYTRARLPVVLRYYESAENRSQASKREYAIKQLSRAKKLHLIQQ